MTLQRCFYCLIILGLMGCTLRPGFKNPSLIKNYREAYDDAKSRELLSTKDILEYEFITQGVYDDSLGYDIQFYTQDNLYPIRMDALDEVARGRTEYLWQKTNFFETHKAKVGIKRLRWRIQGLDFDRGKYQENLEDLLYE